MEKKESILIYPTTEVLLQFIFANVIYMDKTKTTLTLINDIKM